MTPSTFQLQPTESVRAGIVRVIGAQLDTVRTQVRAPKSGVRRPGETESVPVVRKSFKRVRAALRLARDGLGPELYRKENACFREAARPLAKIRDVEVLSETVTTLRRQRIGAIDAAALAALRQILLVAPRPAGEERALARARTAATRALVRLPHWAIEGDGWSVLEAGLRRVYRSGRRARASATSHASAKRLHEWRKQAMYLWHELELLQAISAARVPALADRAHTLSKLLGEDHDLAVLRAMIAADPKRYGGKRGVHAVIRLIDRRRAGLQRRAFALGRNLYRDSPKRFVKRSVQMHPERTGPLATFKSGVGLES